MRRFALLVACAGAAAFGRAIGTAPHASAEPVGDIPRVRMVRAFPQLVFERPVFITHAGDENRLFVVEQGGRVLVFPADDGAASARVFLDLRTQVRTEHNEEGLLALAFHPQYATRGTFFVFYSASKPRRGVLSRFEVDGRDPNRAKVESETVLLEVPKRWGNHNGATLLFGPDGFLYLSLGDGGSAGDPLDAGQDLASLLGKILRLDVDRADGTRAYAIPVDNPYVGVASARPEIWAYGLRNVWRMSFDRETGELWAGDVGQDEWEEIDRIVRGGNYGWRIREGAHVFRRGTARAPLIDPVFEYGRKEGACVVGGYVYRGTRMRRLVGAYVYADYVTGTIWALRARGDSLLAQGEILSQPRNIASFGEGHDGEIYLCAFDGRIYTLAEAP